MIRLIVMGVSGSGKSSVGEGIAAALSLPFIEGDVLHPESNVRKMSAGIPLTDEDRWPWLDKIGAELAKAENGVVVSCSALKKMYRDRLRQEAGGTLAFVFLDGSLAVLRDHMGKRTGHFMPLSMLDSQLATLESPTGEPLVFTQDVAHPITQIVEASVEWLRAQTFRD
ncbi:gluconokinase [Phyllobacterium myrsinacearum]|uniref:Gluconokinase n=1 Tax=Phyllobacterium myrsinacearum TaxID=28101 RepID=A0A2S9J9L9_9HYPH|nr:gluconokinase [Phyllobacterium myrsinacearum]PRD49486.1 gluconokinase [Phyllobacterium myrsinacearum]PWV83360.1 gluconate kinase (SKI family) [Phyllobacterium myrsinacearum]RZS69827.1 gluconate kinase (SKI family) [Phyllobacterium myrsinacearum]RZU96753.1 gluconokinase [Phyllobacterium myrsinacearum]